MNRSAFLATVSAAIASTALPATAAPVAEQAETPILYTGAIRVWQFDDGYPIVFAETAEEAISWASSYGYVDPPYDKPRLMRPDKHVTFIYEDGVPEHLQADEDCECDARTIEEFGCDCGAASNQVTMPAAHWAADRSALQDRIVEEYGTY